ncbi:hypothetical protein Tco_1226056 [Tanacetum coccineum]
MPYPRFTKVIINHFISKDKTIFMRNMINLYTVHDDTLLGTLKFVSKTQDYQQYEALIPNEITNQDIKDSKAYKTYLDFANGKETPKKARKFKKVASPSRKLSHVLEKEPADKPNESMPKKKTPAKVVRGKGMDLLSDVALLEAAQLKKTLKKSKPKTHKLHASGSGDSGDDESNDDDSDEVTKDDDDDDVDSDADGDKEASDSKKTDSDEEENPNLNQNDDEEEEYEEEYVRTPNSIEFTDNDEEYKELYKDKTEVPLQSSSVSSDFANQFLNLDNVSPTDTEVVSMINVKVRHEEPSTQNPPLLNIHVTVIPKTSTATGSTIPPTILPITPLPQQSTPTPNPAPTTATTVTSIPDLLDFSSMFGFDQRVPALEKELHQFKQADYSTQLLETIKSYTAEFEKKAKDERKRYIDLVEKSMKDIIKDKVKSQLPQFLPKEVSDYATPVIHNSITESLENIILAKFSSQPKSTYEAAASLTDSSKGSNSQPKSSGKCAQAEEPVFEAADTEMPLNQGDDLGNTDDQPNVEAASRDDWFKKPERPLTPNSDYNTTKTINFRPPQT